MSFEQDARNDLALLLRDKTSLGRLTHAEVRSVLAFLESIGFVHMQATAPDETETSTDLPLPLAPPPAA